MSHKKSSIFCISGLLIIILLLSSCVSNRPHYNCTYQGKKFKTYSIYRPFVGQNEYKGGYWGDWRRNTSLRYEVKYTYPGFEITFYNKYNHPADFEYKIIVKSRRGSENNWEWEVFAGEIQIKKSLESNMRSKYTKDISGIDALKDVWTFPATIKRTSKKLPEEKYIFPQLPTEMKYVYNIFYNGVGRAFEINGIWVGADKIDPWK